MTTKITAANTPLGLVKLKFVTNYIYFLMNPALKNMKLLEDGDADFAKMTIIDRWNNLQVQKQGY